MQLTGIKTEIKQINIEVTDKELLRALKKRVGTTDLTLNKEETELGCWKDLSSERSNFENWHWVCESKDKDLIEVCKAIKVLKEFILKKEN